MACSNSCKLCRKLIISTAVTFTAATGLVVRIPEGAYNDNEKYCIVIAQRIPDEATISAPVYVQIGTGAALYPLVTRQCRTVTAAGIRTRTRYSTRVETTSDSGLFRMLGNPCCTPDNRLTAISGDGTPVTG